MEIQRVELDRAALAEMPQNERVLLLALGHASNEINVLAKLILMTRKDDAPSMAVDHVEAGQAFILIRILIGKLHEAWELFKKRAQSDQAIATKRVAALPADAKDALKRLNQHFGQSSVLTAIRNQISFHYSDKENLTEANFQRLDPGEPLQFYLAGNIGNCFFHASELIAQLNLISLLKVPPADANDNRSDEARALEALYGEIIGVSRDLLLLFGRLIEELGKGTGEKLTVEIVPDGPKLSEYNLPFFFAEDDSFPQK